jgi:hypothetical protein
MLRGYSLRSYAKKAQVSTLLQAKMAQEGE